MTAPQGFNSRTLGRVRLFELVVIVISLVSIHAPWEGCDCVCVCVVSIHAPWEGCDQVVGVIIAPIVSFNSRTLGRVRHARQAVVLVILPFQFTHPGKGATLLGRPLTSCQRSFNSRTLGRVRHRDRPCRLVSQAVSIHAPWEGCDVIKRAELPP